MAVDAQSATGRIAQAIESIIRGLSLNPAPVQFARRKKLQFLDGDKLPLVLISVSEDEEFEPLGVRGKGYWWRITRGTQIALAYPAQGRTGNNEALRIARDTIWPAITPRTLLAAGLTEIDDIAPAGKAIFGPESTPNVDWSLLAPLTVATLEIR